MAKKTKKNRDRAPWKELWMFAVLGETSYNLKVKIYTEAYNFYPGM